MKIIFELSGEHPELPLIEAESVADIEYSGKQYAVGKCARPEDTLCLAMTHTVLEYLGECPADATSLEYMIKNLRIHTFSPFAARVKKIDGTPIEISQISLEKMIGTHIEGPVSLKNPVAEYRAICSKDRCVFGRVLFRIDRSSFGFRNPMRRHFFHPGVMMPLLARALVNISRAGNNEILLDPFCGTGGVLLEAEMLGVIAIGSDFDGNMIAGAKNNLVNPNLQIADATKLPFRNESIDAVVTDLPYGQSVRIRAESFDILYREALEEFGRVLKTGKLAVVVTHRDIRPIITKPLRVIAFIEQRVHKSLTRRIHIIVKEN